MLPLETPQPDSLLWAPDLNFRILCQCQVVRNMGTPGTSARRAHVAYYLALAEDAEIEIGGPKQAIWLGRLEREHDNLRAALSWLLEQAEMKESTEGEYNRELALRLGGA